MNAISQFPAPDEDGLQDVGWFSPGGDAGGLNLRYLIGVLRRRKVMIAAVMAVITTVAAVLVNGLTPLYSAEAQIVVEPDRQNVVDIESVVQGLSPDFYTNETEAAVIGSRALAEKAVDHLRLVDDPRFNPLLRAPKQRKPIGGVRAWLLEKLARPGDEVPVEALLVDDDSEPHPLMALAPAERARVVREIATDRYLAGLLVRPSSRSRVIAVSYASPDPEFAALAANAAADVYILDQRSEKGEATTRATEFLARRVNDLRDQVIVAERDIAEYRRQVGLVDEDGLTLFQRQITELNERMATARAVLGEAVARRRQVEQLLREGAGSDTVAAVLDSGLISRLREQEAIVIRKLSELRTTYRTGHPRLKLAVNELEDLQQAIRREVAKVVRNLDNELEIARLRVANLEADVERVRGQLDSQNEARATLSSLLNEQEANRQIYETFLERLKETDILDDTEQQADARIISRATVPGWPYYPNRKLMIAAALVLSAGIGVVLAFVIELLDNGFRSTSQLEAQSGLPALGMLPVTVKAKGEAGRPHQIALAEPNSAYAEAIRSLRTAIMLSSAERSPKSVLVTSSVPGEGKTTTAVALATTAAMSGQNTIVLDCDFRHSNLHLQLDVPNRKGLSDHLTGHASLEDVVEVDPQSGARYITAGSRVPNPTDLLGSDAMRRLLQQLSESFDLVVLDTPPLLVVSDALVLVRAVDKTIFAIRWEKTRRVTALAGLKYVVEAGADVAGAVITRVDVRRHAQYDYADSGNYYIGSYRKYYSD